MLPEQHGRCDNADNCGKWVTPKDTGYAKAIWEQGNRSEIPNNWKPKRKKTIPQPTPEPVFFDFETFKQTLQPENEAISGINAKIEMYAVRLALILQMVRYACNEDGKQNLYNELPETFTTSEGVEVAESLGIDAQTQMQLVQSAKQEFQKMNKYRYTLASNKVKKLDCYQKKVRLI